MSFLSKLRKLVMDEDTMSFDEGIEATKSIMANDSLSEEEKDKALAELKEKGKKAETKDEELKAKMQKATELAGDEDVEDEEEEEKGKKADAKDKDAVKVAMDSDMIESIIAKRVKAEMDKLTNKRSVFDSALEEYQRTCGKANTMAFDSADSIYNAILKNNKINIDGKTLSQKQAMVEMIPTIKKSPSSAIVFDGYSTNKKLIPNELANFLKGK